MDINTYHGSISGTQEYKPLRDNPEILFSDTDYAARVFRKFEVRKDAIMGYGWFIYGTCVTNDIVVRLCAMPNRPRRSHPHYNGPAMPGWPTKKAAAAALADVVRHCELVMLSDENLGENLAEEDAA